ncbi:MAG: sodium bicarbonate transporter family protein [Myxococcota bacterium]
MNRFPDASNPPAALPDDGLGFTGRLAGGLRDDLARRRPFYLDDFRQGLHAKVLASVLFLFFACLANAIAFGGLTDLVTDGRIGTTEMIVATAAGGIAFALFGGQPLTILGGTGPIVIFTGLLYATCERLELPFLATYAWTGIWSGVLLILCAITDASALMRFFTRFTDEIFASLIAVIFIVEAVASMAGPFGETPRDLPAALLGVVLSLGTYSLSRTLKSAAQTRFLVGSARAFLSDFGPTIAIAAMTLVALSLPQIRLEVPGIPERFGTTDGRPWRVELFALPTWAIFASLAPALMATILLFLDQNITTRLVNAPGNRLRKGVGFHLDLLIVGMIVAIGSLFALPWIVAATVHSLNHVRSLATTEVVAANGVQREVVRSVRENRLSGLAIHVLIGCSILILPLIQLIPMAVLFGLFLFMGFNTLAGNQLWDRFLLLFTDPKLYPATHYVRRVPVARIHLFTAVQVIALVALWLLKASALGILFPILIALLVPLRRALARWFPTRELEALDPDEELDEAESDLVGGDVHA